jgi:hypothetical protein
MNTYIIFNLLGIIGCTAGFFWNCRFRLIGLKQRLGFLRACDQEILNAKAVRLRPAFACAWIENEFQIL